MPPSALGLSVEWDSLLAYTTPPRARTLTRLMARVSRLMGSPLALRVGGDSADQSWWNPSHRPRPPRVLQDITPHTLAALGTLARALGGPVTLDVNLALHDPLNAAALVRAAQRRLPHNALDAVEIGNEPDLYTAAHTFGVPGHVHRRLLKYHRYSVARYIRDAGHYLIVLKRSLQPSPQLGVAGFAGAGWWSHLRGALRRWRRRASILSAHLYAVPGCGGPTPPIRWLLSARASRGRAATLAPLARIARAARLPMRVTELNSAACGGRAGFSDRFAAALWLTDTLFALLREGSRQTDLHTWQHARYAPFDARGERVVARAPLVGMLAFARAAPAGSRLANVHLAGAAVRAWATVDAVGTVRVALIAPRRIAAIVHIAGGGRCGSLWLATRHRRLTRSLCGLDGRYRVVVPAQSLAVFAVWSVTPARTRRRRESPQPLMRSAPVLHQPLTWAR